MQSGPSLTDLLAENGGLPPDVSDAQREAIRVALQSQASGTAAATRTAARTQVLELLVRSLARDLLTAAGDRRLG